MGLKVKKEPNVPNGDVTNKSQLSVHKANTSFRTELVKPHEMAKSAHNDQIDSSQKSISDNEMHLQSQLSPKLSSYS